MQNEPNNNRNPCDELNDLLPAYAIGATTPEESARVRALLPDCPDQAADLMLYADLSTGLLDEVAPVEPPAALRAKVLGGIGTSSQETRPVRVTPMPVPPPSRTRDSGRWAWGAAAAVLALLVVSNLYWIVTLSETQDTLNKTETALFALQNEQNNVISLLTNQNTVRVAMRTTSDNADLGTVLYDPTDNSGTLIAGGLPPLDTSQTYQLWLIGDTVASAGVFEVNADGDGVYVFDPGTPPQDFSLIGISVEPAGGSDAPTTDPIGVGEITAS